LLLAIFILYLFFAVVKMIYDAVAIHFGEIWLKGRNRKDFVKRLYINVVSALQGENYDRLENERDRFMLYLNKDSDIEAMEKSLHTVFGVSWYAPVKICKNGIDDIFKASKELVKSAGIDKVKIVAARSYKALPYDSRDIVARFFKGRESLGFELDKNADAELSINVRAKDAVLRLGKTRGLGGLPVGSSGRAIVLLSGGIDSPLAAFYAMKKGLFPIYLHVHAYADNARAEKSKISALASILAPYSCGAKVYYAPAHVFQAHVMKTPKSYELVLFKYFAYSLAEHIAKKEHAKVIVTGESLAQVASQTVENLTASEQDTTLFVMRPLIGFDKQEIINQAKKLGTYDLSIEAYPDVCSLRAKHPATASKSELVKTLYKSAKLRSAVTETIKKTACLELGM
jgi:thiamine biosynthesis protein ThiI